MSKVFNLPVKRHFQRINEADNTPRFDTEAIEAAVIAINKHDEMAIKLSEFRAFFEGIIEHAPEGAPVESLEIYRGFIEDIDATLGN